MGEAGDWLEYDSELNALRKKDQNSDLPVGEYNLIAKLEDDSDLGEKERLGSVLRGHLWKGSAGRHAL